MRFWGAGSIHWQRNQIFLEELDKIELVKGKVEGPLEETANPRLLFYERFYPPVKHTN